MSSNGNQYVIFYATVIEGKKHDGIYVDYAYFGGITNDEEYADCLSRNIVNDRSIPGIVIPKVFVKSSKQSLSDVIKIADYYMKKMASRMYDSEEIQERTKRKRR